MAILIDHGNLKRSVLRSRRLEKANKIRQELREKYDYIPWLNRIIPKFSKKFMRQKHSHVFIRALMLIGIVAIKLHTLFPLP